MTEEEKAIESKKKEIQTLTQLLENAKRDLRRMQKKREEKT